MPNVIVTGGPGAGKTVLLAELARAGYITVAESARSVISGRLAAGLSPRPEPVEFAREILRRDIAAYNDNDIGPSGWRFFDRGPIDALGSLFEAGDLVEKELQTYLRQFSFWSTVFILPPWEEIYTTDAERDQTYAEAVVVYGKLRSWYARCGYTLHEVPRLSVGARAGHVLAVLERRASA